MIETFFGYSRAADYWADLGRNAWARFNADPIGRHAIEAAQACWHVHEWVWYDANPGISTRRNPNYAAFKKDLYNQCGNLERVEDIALAGKHRALDKNSQVAAVHRPRVTRTTPIIGAGSGQVIQWSTGSYPMLVRFNNKLPPVLFVDLMQPVINFWDGYPFKPA